MFEVSLSEHMLRKAHDRFGDERTASGAPSEYDFVAGPVAAAVNEFRYFDDLPDAMGPAIRSLIVVDPFFGAIVFVGVLVGRLRVEIADFEDDPDYWSLVDPPLD